MIKMIKIKRSCIKKEYKKRKQRLSILIVIYLIIKQLQRSIRRRKGIKRNKWRECNKDGVINELELDSWLVYMLNYNTKLIFKIYC